VKVFPSKPDSLQAGHPEEKLVRLQENWAVMQSILIVCWCGELSQKPNYINCKSQILTLHPYDARKRIVDMCLNNSQTIGQDPFPQNLMPLWIPMCCCRQQWVERTCTPAPQINTASGGPWCVLWVICLCCLINTYWIFPPVLSTLSMFIELELLLTIHNLTFFLSYKCPDYICVDSSKRL
jgi:hypothetical protein